MWDQSCISDVLAVLVLLMSKLSSVSSHTAKPSLPHPHCYTLTATPSLPHPHCHTLTATPSPPHPHCHTLMLHPHCHTLTATPSLPHPHCYTLTATLCHTLTATPSLPHPHCHTLTATPSLLHPHCHTLTATPSLPHPHCHTLTATPSLPHLHFDSILMRVYSMLVSMCCEDHHRSEAHGWCVPERQGKPGVCFLPSCPCGPSAREIPAHLPWRYVHGCVVVCWQAVMSYVRALVGTTFDHVIMCQCWGRTEGCSLSLTTIGSSVGLIKHST